MAINLDAIKGVAINCMPEFTVYTVETAKEGGGGGRKCTKVVQKTG